jgi:cytochrome c oxidase cbb3-type subunit I/II
MVFSVMLWMPSWGGMVNGLLTLRGAWHKVVEDPVLKFYVVAVTAYGMATFEGPMLSVKSVNGLAHYTDWIIAHVHTGALGWNGFLTFGLIYWLLPRVFQARLHSTKLAELHFWLALFGVVLYAAPIYTAGLTQGLMWRAFDDTGRLQFPDFVETTMRLVPMYWMRVMGGTLYVMGVILCGWNLLKTWSTRPKVYEEPVIQAPPLGSKRYLENGEPRPAGWWSRLAGLGWHRRWEGLPLTFTVWTAVAVIVASLFEILPTFLIRSNVPTIAAVRPYTPLELAGRDLYIREGCFNCHSQMVRPMRPETERYGEYSKPGEFVFDHPFLWGSRRIGPDLARVGGKYPDLWHVRHMEAPRAITPRSIMPPYPELLSRRLDFAAIQSRVDAMAMLGVPYGDAIHRAAEMAREQAREVAARIAEQGGPAGLEDREIAALVAYLQRLGADIRGAGVASEAAAGGQ